MGTKETESSMNRRARAKKTRNRPKGCIAQSVTDFQAYRKNLDLEDVQSNESLEVVSNPNDKEAGPLSEHEYEKMGPRIVIESGQVDSFDDTHPVNSLNHTSDR